MLSCEFCGKEWEKKHSYVSHVNACKLNPNRKFKNQWVKAKEAGSQYVLKEETRQKFRESASKQRHSEETKKKISETRKAYLDKNPDKVPYLLNHSSKVSYPEEYFIECLKEFPDIQFQYPVSRYKLDFASPARKLYLEIDGEQHYVSKKMVKHDEARTFTLEQMGWKGLRIRWAHFQKLSENEKKEEVKKIVEWFNVGM